MSPRLFLPATVFLLLFSCQQTQRKGNASEVKRNGVNISYTACGKGDTTLLFVHGWGITKEYWKAQLRHFCDRYRVVAIDLPGFGQSGKERTDWNFDEYTEDIKTVIDQLDLKNVVLIGHSMSGDIVLNVANKYPAAAIGWVGIDNLQEPGGPMNEEQQRQADTFFMQLSSHFDSTVSIYVKKSLFQPTTDISVVNRVMNDILTTDSTIAIKVLRGVMTVAQREQELMTRLPKKLYLINSDVVPTRLDSLNKYCRYGCEVVTVHASGHYPMVEKPDDFNAAVEKVMAKISGEKNR
ncbi:MAG TPA: alpha/beta hydrolase [Chitinophagaceae bacterium]|nr:alpha/beta hydrolase [Chitinophagaceae bacterium]